MSFDYALGMGYMISDTFLYQQEEYQVSDDERKNFMLACLIKKSVKKKQANKNVKYFPHRGSAERGKYVQ